LQQHASLIPLILYVLVLVHLFSCTIEYQKLCYMATILRRLIIALEFYADSAK
jgi:hypothetical protein